MANRKNSMRWSLKASTVRTLAWDLESRKEPCWVPCLLFVNDISNDITSNIKLFGDDSLLYGLVHNSDDAISLQSDLDKLVEWAKLWQMAFNPSKCYVLRVCRTKCPFIHPYTMLGHTVQVVDHYPYLGVSLSWDLKRKPRSSSHTVVLGPERTRFEFSSFILIGKFTTAF